MMAAMRKTKRGLDYIDWSMSLGLFLVAVVALFVFIKPGVQTPYDGASLISIVEQNFFAEAGTMLKQTPMFMYHLVDKYNPGSNNAEIEVTLDSTWHIAAVQPPATAMFPYVKQNTAVTWDCPSTCDKKNFTIYWAANNKNANDPLIELDCTPSGDRNSCDAALGATTTQEGLEQQFIDGIKAEAYQQVKARWKYPQTKEFAIYLNNIFEIGIMPPAEGNIVAKEIKYWKIQGSSRMPIAVRIMVW